MPRAPSASTARRGAALLAPPEARRSSRLVSSLGPGSKPGARSAIKGEGEVKQEPGASAASSATEINVAQPFVKAEPDDAALAALPLAHDPAVAAAAHAALASGSSLAALLDDPSSPALRQAAARLKSASQRAEALHGLPPLMPAADVRLRTHILRPALPYDFDAARAHLENADPRFRILFHQADFRKYLSPGNEGPENLNLFKSLATSILGQQISWKAARAICLKFLALFDASTLDAPPAPPASADEEDPVSALPFPTPLQVLALPEGAIRSAGVSLAKERALRDIAHRFADGRLDARRLATATTEAAWEEMIAARGVGPWTVQMILMLALRMPDILPVGDVGVQNGMLKFFLASATGPAIPPRRRRPMGADEPETPLAQQRSCPPLPSGMRPEMLRARLSKKFKKGAALQPEEMERLTESWKPFRSLACLLMWPIADVLV